MKYDHILILIIVSFSSAIAEQEGNDTSTAKPAGHKERSEDDVRSFLISRRKELKDLQRKVCIHKDRLAQLDMIMRLQCVEQHSTLGTWRTIKLLWEDIVGSPYPETSEQFIDAFCCIKDLFLKKDLVDVAFMLKQISHVDSFRTAKSLLHRYSSCPHFNRTEDMLYAIHSKLSWDSDQQSIASMVASLRNVLHKVTGKKMFQSKGIIGSEDIFAEKVDRCDLSSFNASDTYCVKKREYAMNMTHICDHKNHTYISDLINQHRCLERSSGHRMSNELRTCWRLVTGEDYPRSDADFIIFNCKRRYPLAIRRIVDNCYYERLYGHFVSSSRTTDVQEQLAANITAEENMRHCAMPVWRESDDAMTAVYRIRYNKLRTRYQKEKTCGMRDSLRMTKEIMADVTCPEYRLGREMRIILKFCWKYSAGREYPRNQDEWMQLLCNEQRIKMRGIEARINPCIRAGPSLMYGSEVKESLRKQLEDQIYNRLQLCSHLLPFSDRDIEVEGV